MEIGRKMARIHHSRVEGITNNGIVAILCWDQQGKIHSLQIPWQQAMDLANAINREVVNSPVWEEELNKRKGIENG